MKEVLLTLLSLTLSGSLLCVLLLLIRPALRNKVPKAFTYYIWLAVLLRFLVPVGYGIHLPEPPQPVREAVTQETQLPHQAEVQSTPVTPPTEQDPVEQEETPEPPAPVFSLTGVLFVLWLAVGACFFCWHMAAYALFSHRIRASLTPPPAETLALFRQLEHSRRVGLACSSQVDTPMLMGFFHPVVVLPQRGLLFNGPALSSVLRHELTHHQRGDLFYKWLVTLVTSLHWFNPLVHWMGRQIALDCELACDEAVIRSMDPAQRMDYGDMLLMLAARQGRTSAGMAVTLCEEKRQLKARLLGIKGYRKPGRATVCLALILGLLVVCCACTVVDVDPQPKATTGESDPYQALLARYEEAFLQQQPDDYPDLVSAVIAPYWGQDHQIGYARRDLDGDGSEELLLGWVGNDIWNLDQGYVFAIYTLVDSQPVLAVEGWERNLYVVREDGILCHCGSSGAGRTEWHQYRFDPSAEGFLVALDQVSVPVDGEGAVTIGESWMESGVALPYTSFSGSGKSPYQDVLLGNTSFLYRDDSGQGVPTFLPDIPLAFSPYSSYAAVTEFAVLDLNGDGSREVVLRVTDVANDMGGYVVLRQEEDAIYGYPSHWRTFWQLKTDGTFTYSYTAGTEDGIASARFGEDGLTLEKHIRCEMEAWEPKAFEVDGRPVSETEYEAACSAQDQKTDAVWYELNETNIRQLTA